MSLSPPIRSIFSWIAWSILFGLMAWSVAWGIAIVAAFLLLLLILVIIIIGRDRFKSARAAASLREALEVDPMGVYPGIDAWQRAEKMAEAYGEPWGPMRDLDPDVIRPAEPHPALAAAIRSGSRETVEALLEAEGDVKAFQKANFEVAVSCGDHDILRLLLSRGAGVPELQTPFDAGVEEGILMLFEIGEVAMARDFARAAAAVDLSHPGTELLERARRLGSVFTAFAERFSALRDHRTARQLCGWKIRRWLRMCDEYLPMAMAACLRTLANVYESEGRIQEAVRIRRTVLRVWRINDLWDMAPEIAGFVLGSGHKPLSKTELLRTVELVPNTWCGEFEEQLRQCEQSLGSLGKSLGSVVMLEEQRRIAAMFPLLEARLVAP